MGDLKLRTTAFRGRLHHHTTTNAGHMQLIPCAEALFACGHARVVLNDWLSSTYSTNKNSTAKLLQRSRALSVAVYQVSYCDLNRWSWRSSNMLRKAFLKNHKHRCCCIGSCASRKLELQVDAFLLSCFRVPKPGLLER